MTPVPTKTQAACLQLYQTGMVSGVWSNTANALHTIGMAGLCYLSAGSFRGIVDAAKGCKNSLPHLMLACSRLSVVLGQISAMSLSTAVITLVGATSQWPKLVLMVSAGAAAAMVLRLTSSYFLMLQFGGKGSVIDAISNFQAGVNGAPVARETVSM